MNENLEEYIYNNIDVFVNDLKEKLNDYINDIVVEKQNVCYNHFNYILKLKSKKFDVILLINKYEFQEFYQDKLTRNKSKIEDYDKFVDYYVEQFLKKRKEFYE